MIVGLWTIFSPTPVTRADVIQVQALPSPAPNYGCNGSTLSDSPSSASLSVSCAGSVISGGGSVTFIGSATMGDFQSSISISTQGAGTLAEYFTQSVTATGVASTVCPGGNGAVECYAGSNPTDPPAGTALEAELTFTVNGTETGSYNLPNSSAGTQLTASVDDNSIMNTQATGTVVSDPFTFTAGTPFNLYAEFDTSAKCPYGSCSIDFSDPELSDVTVIDPTTGKPVLGLQFVGDDGTVYPTNVGIPSPEGPSVPEPPSLSLLGTGLLGLVLLTGRQFGRSLRLCVKGGAPAPMSSHTQVIRRAGFLDI